MEGLQGLIGLPLSKVEPRGLGTGHVESLTGYASRISARIAVPPRIFVQRAFDDAGGGAGARTPSAVTAAARRLNVGARGSDVADAVGRLTGRPDLRRLSYFAFLDLFGIPERGVLAPHRRWCPRCWEADGDEPYERKFWWLALVEVCHVHGCFLEVRCLTCGRSQPVLPRSVRLHVCSHCGHDLRAAASVSGTGPAFDRMVWYARQGAALVHAGEAIALTGSDEVASLKRAYPVLAVYAATQGFPAVQRFFQHEIHRLSESKLEALMSALWQLKVGVPRLFSKAVREMLER